MDQLVVGRAVGLSGHREKFTDAWRKPASRKLESGEGKSWALPQMVNATPPRCFKVYLAGPIAGLTYDQSEDWRDRVKAMLPPEIVCYSPLRGKQALRDLGTIGAAKAYSEEITPLATDRGIMRRDYYDCTTSDLIICNFLGAKDKSIGSCFELAWAYAHQIPLILVMEASDNPHEHPMVRESYLYRVDTLEKAAALSRAVLLP